MRDPRLLTDSHTVLNTALHYITHCLTCALARYFYVLRKSESSGMACTPTWTCAPRSPRRTSRQSKPAASSSARHAATVSSRASLGTSVSAPAQHISQGRGATGGARTATTACARQLRRKTVRLRDRDHALESHVAHAERVEHAVIHTQQHAQLRLHCRGLQGCIAPQRAHSLRERVH